jgi:hypothetical protein
MMTAAHIGKIARPSASATNTPDGLAGGLGEGLGAGLGGGLMDAGLCAGDGPTLDEGGTWSGADPDVGDGESGADGGRYGGTGNAGRVGVLAKSCSETGGRPALSTWPLAHPDETTQAPRGKGVAVG